MSSVRNDFLMTSVSTIVACVGAFSAVLSSTTLVCVMVFLFIVPIIISLVDADAHILTALSPPLACVLQHQSCNLPAKPLSAASSSTTHALLSFLGVVLLVRAVRSPVDKRNAQLTRTVFIALSGAESHRATNCGAADAYSHAHAFPPSFLPLSRQAAFSYRLRRVWSTATARTCAVQSPKRCRRIWRKRLRLLLVGLRGNSRQ